MSYLDRALPADFVEMCWKEMEGSRLCEDVDNNVSSSAEFYKIGGNAQATQVLMESRAVVAMSEMIWTLVTKLPSGHASKGVGLVIFKTAVTSAIRFGMYMQRRAQEKGNLIQ